MAAQFPLNINFCSIPFQFSINLISILNRLVNFSSIKSQSYNIDQTLILTKDWENTDLFFWLVPVLQGIERTLIYFSGLCLSCRVLRGQLSDIDIDWTLRDHWFTFPARACLAGYWEKRTLIYFSGLCLSCRVLRGQLSDIDIDWTLRDHWFTWRRPWCGTWPRWRPPSSSSLQAYHKQDCQAKKWIISCKTSTSQRSNLVFSQCTVNINIWSMSTQYPARQAWAGEVNLCSLNVWSKSMADQ